MDTLQYILLALLIGYLFWVRSKDKKEIETYKSYSETMMLMVRELKQEVEKINEKYGSETAMAAAQRHRD